MGYLLVLLSFLLQFAFINSVFAMGASPNYIVNGDFELALDKPWQILRGEKKINIVTKSTNPVDHDLEIRATADTRPRIYQDIPVTPGQAFHFSFDVSALAEPYDGIGLMKILFINKAGYRGNWSIHYMFVGTKPMKETETVVVPPGAVKMRIVLGQLDHKSNKTKYVYYDNLNLVEATPSESDLEKASNFKFRKPDATGGGSGGGGSDDENDSHTDDLVSCRYDVGAYFTTRPDIIGAKYDCSNGGNIDIRFEGCHDQLVPSKIYIDWGQRSIGSTPWCSSSTIKY